MQKCVLVCISLLLAVSATFASERVFYEEFSADQLSIETARGLDVIVWPGAVAPDIHGVYQLPEVHRTYLLPPDTRVTEVTGIVTDSLLLGTGLNIQMVTDTMARDNRQVEETVHKVVSLSQDGFWQGNHLTMVVIRPLRFDPASGNLILYTQVKLVVQESSGARDVAIRNFADEQSLRYVQDELREQISNPEAVESYSAAPQSKSGTSLKMTSENPIPSENGAPVQYVIITTNALASTFTSFADWKTKLGTNAIVVTVEWIEDHYTEGVDTPDRIRRFIRHAYENWGTEWILLGGDHSLVPSRITWVPDYSGKERLSDYYYACLDGDWNLDGDYHYGEYYDDIDLMPEVYVGRAPVSTVNQALLFIDKVISYAQSSPYSDYQTQALIVGSNMFVHGDAAQVGDQIATYLPGSFSTTKLYEYNADGSEGNLLTKQPAIDAINQGHNLVFGLHHTCNNLCWVVIDEHGRDDIGASDAGALSNDNKFGVFYSISCGLGDFEYDCLARQFLLSQSGGAAAFISSTFRDAPFLTDILAYEFANQIFNQNTTEVGKALATAKEVIMPYALYGGARRDAIICYALLGDPQMRIWTQTPEPLTITTFPSEFQNNQDYALITVTVTSNSQPVSDAAVTLWYGNSIYETDLTNAQGEVVFQNVGVLGNLCYLYVGADKQGYLPAIQNKPVSFVDAAIVLVDRAINDDMTGGSSGNGNGVIEAGETIEFTCNVFNYGAATATNAYVDMASADPAHVDIVTGHSYVGNIPTINALPLQQSLIFHIDPAVPDQTVFSQLSLTTGMDGASWSETYTVVINAPVLTKDIHVIDDDNIGDSNGDGDGVIESGETVELTIDIRNDGYGEAGSVWAELSSPSPDVSISPTYNTVQYGDALARSVTTPPGSFVFTYTGTGGGSLPFDLTIHDEYARVTQVSFQIVSLSATSSISCTPYSNAIDVSWPPAPGVAALSYIVYRGDTPSPLYRVSTQPISGASHYMDKDLLTDQDYYYQVSVIDQYGNEGPRSPIFSAATNPPLGGGLPISAPEGYPWSVVHADLDLNGIEEILYAKGNTVYAFTSTGGSYISGAGGVLYTVPDANFVWSGPTVADLDGDGFLDVLIADATGTDGGLHCYEIRGQSVNMVFGWPKALGDGAGFFSAPVVADLDADYEQEVLFLTDDGDLFIWNADGTPFLIGQPLFHDFTAGGGSMTCPAIGDVDGDGVLEIVVAREGNIFVFEQDGTNATNFPVPVENGLGDPVIGDIDPTSPGFEIAVIAGQKRVHVIRADGTEPTGWPFERFPLYLVYYSMTSPTLGDVTGDGNIEVIATLNNMLYVLDQNGVPLSGWPKTISNVPCVEHTSSALIADVDGNNVADIVATFLDQNIYAFDCTGAPISGFPIPHQGGNPLAITRNLDDTRISITTVNDSLFLWQCGDNHPDLVYAGQRNHDAHRTGYWWGNEPLCSAIGISSTPVYINQIKTVSVTTSDPDIIYGDATHYIWSAKRGSIIQVDANSTTYTAPATTGADTIWIKVTDLGGNVHTRFRAFTVSTSGGGGGGSCPFLMVWDGATFKEENTILTQSEYTASGIPVVDHYALENTPALEGGYYRLRLEEREDEISYIDNVKLLIVDNGGTDQSVHITPDGKLFYADEYLMPTTAVDYQGNDILDKVSRHDTEWYSANTPGWVIVSYEVEGDVHGLSYIEYGVAQKDRCDELPPILKKENPDPPPDNDNQQGSLHISYRVDNDLWIDMPETPPRENSTSMYTSLLFEIQNGSRVDVKYEWQRQWRVDVLSLLMSSDEAPQATELIPEKAFHSDLKQVSSIVSAPDNEFSVINKGQFIDLYFPATTAASEFATYIVEAKGYYTPMRSTLGQPTEFALHPSYPNPFNAETKIDFTLPHETDVTIIIYNVLGQTVQTLVSERLPAGQHSVSWDSHDKNGYSVASGIYLVRMHTSDFEATRKVTLLK